MTRQRGDAMVALLIAVVVAFVIAAVYFVRAQMKADAAWNAWAAQHCRVVGHMQGSSDTTTVVTTSGKVGIGTVDTPSKTEFACDDGVTYWRND